MDNVHVDQYVVDFETRAHSNPHPNDIEMDDDSGSDFSDDQLDDPARRQFYLGLMEDLERAFNKLKDRYFTERLRQLKDKMDELKANKLKMYVDSIQQLEAEMNDRISLAHTLRDLKLESANMVLEGDLSAEKDDLRNKKQMLWDSIKLDLDEKICARSLEEERELAPHDVNNPWQEPANPLKRKRQTTTERKKKPTNVTGPYIIYLLPEEQILEDLQLIKKALKSSRNHSSRVQAKKYKSSKPFQALETIDDSQRGLICSYIREEVEKNIKLRQTEKEYLNGISFK